jgi:DNA modification methylase
MPSELRDPSGERRLVSESRNYSVLTTEDAKTIAAVSLAENGLGDGMSFGLPEIDDRYHVWRVPLVTEAGREKIGEVVIDAKSAAIQPNRTTTAEVLQARLERKNAEPKKRARGRAPQIELSPLANTILQGDSEETLRQLPAGSVDLAFTSPPYYNARPDYTDYVGYDEYLERIAEVIRQVHRVLAEGRFFVMNVAPVLLRRASRNEASRRIAVPFDMHRLFTEEGFTFIDDIIWEKPSGAGWATGRGRRFAADRNPLQYKAVPVTEYVLVYRKNTDRLIDWNIRNHPDPGAVERSKVDGDYETTNVWRIKPAHSRLHPAVFPVALAERVIRYYSFEGDVVLDPFAGIGTVGRAAVTMDRRFVLAEKNPDYVDEIRRRAVDWLGAAAAEVTCVGCEAPDTSGVIA